MADRNFWVIVYDISDDKRRTRLHTALLDYGTPVQYSVFECWVTAEQFKKLQGRVRKIIKPRKDHVRYYALCVACAGKAQTTQAGEITKPEKVLVV